jgi:putative sigma-54 modulation protein
MNFKIRGTNISITNSLREYAEKKIVKLEKYFDENLTSDVFVSFKVHKTEQRVEVTIPFSPLVFRAEESHEDMYAAIDLVVEKLVRQIQKYKAKATRWKRKRNIVGEDYIGKDHQVDSEEDSYHIVRQKNFNLKPMDAQEAVLQMDMLGHSFFIFSESIGGNTNVVYKRKDGKYGLIIPE